MRKLLALLGSCTFGFAAASTLDAPAYDRPTAAPAYSIGVAGGVVPRYLGSKDYHPVAVPVFAVVLPSGLFASATEGIGARFSSASGIFGSAAVTYDLARKDENRPALPGSDHLHGMGDVKGSMVSVLRLGYYVTPRFSISSTLRVPLTNRERGITSRTAMEYSVIDTGRDVVALSAGVLAGSRKYNQTFFGVTSAQAASSGFAGYSPGAGVYGADSSLVWTHKVSSNWSITSAASVTSLVGDSAKSPIVQRRLAYHVLSSVNYSF